MADFSKIDHKIKKLVQYLSHDIHEVIGSEAVNHFENSFQNEGFTDSKLKKWDDVKRRDKASSWYGFKYRADSKHPYRKKRKATSRSNFSPAATKRKAMIGNSKMLKRSIRYKRQGNKVIVYSDLPYAKVHNEGGTIKVFGKHSVKLKQRQFMGKSKQLDQKIHQEIRRDIRNILNR